MSHEYHPEATAAGVLSVHCEDCQSKRIYSLDPDHQRSALGVDAEDVRDFLIKYPQLRIAFDHTSAISIQAAYLAERPAGWQQKFDAMCAPLPQRSTS